MQLKRTAALLTFAALALTARPAHAQQTFTFIFSGYSSSLINSNGTYKFASFGTATTTLSLTPGVSTQFSLDVLTSANFDDTATNGVTPGVFADTASSDLTFSYGGNSLGTQTLSDAYTLDGTNAGISYPTFSGGDALTFAVGGGQQLTITPIGSYKVRAATALLSPAPTAAPEPSTWLPFAFMGLAATGLILKAQRRHA